MEEDLHDHFHHDHEAGHIAEELDMLRKGIDHDKHLLHYELKHASHDLWEAWIFSLIQLMFPINIIVTTYFLNKTKRTANIFSFLTLIELLLFVLVIIWT